MHTAYHCTQQTTDPQQSTVCAYSYILSALQMHIIVHIRLYAPYMHIMVQVRSTYTLIRSVDIYRPENRDSVQKRPNRDSVQKRPLRDSVQKRPLQQHLLLPAVCLPAAPPPGSPLRGLLRWCQSTLLTHAQTHVGLAHLSVYLCTCTHVCMCVRVTVYA